MKYQIKFEHKGEIIEVKPDPVESCLFISGKPVALDHYGANTHPFLLNKQLVCRIYDTLLNELTKTPKNYFKSLEFNDLVPALRLIVGTDRFLRKLRALNGSGNAEKIGEQVSAAVRAAMASNYESHKRFSDPQRWVMCIVAPDYAGGEIDAYDFSNCYDPIKDDDSKMQAKLKEFEAYPFTKFITKNEASAVLAKVKKDVTEVRASIAVFQCMRDIAGDDLVNWGPHKYASRIKTAGITESGYQAKHWLLTDLKNNLLKKGIKPVEKKATSLDKIKARYNADLKDDFETGETASIVEVSQDDLVKLFKAGTDSQSREYIAQMTPETAISLLAIPTKNVTSKLYDTHAGIKREGHGLKAIVEVVAAGNYPKEFKQLIRFLRDNGMMSACTWQLFLNHVGEFVIHEFLEFAMITENALPEGMEYLDRPFFDKVISRIPMMQRYTVNYYVSDAFLRYFAGDAEKERVLVDARSHKTEDRNKIDWELSAIHFYKLPYRSIKTFLDGDSGSTGDRAYPEWEFFQDLIIQNKDIEIARKVLIFNPRFSDIPYPFFELFTLDEKIEILDSSSSQNFDIQHILKKNELKDFGRIALTKENLCSYVSKLPVEYLNDNITLADVTTRLLGGEFYVPLTDKIIKNLSKESALRIIARSKLIDLENANYHSREAKYDANAVLLKSKLYAKLTRDEIVDILGARLPESRDYLALAKFMTPDEIVESCNRSNDFFRMHLAIVPDGYISHFKSKEEFKKAVGDRRKSTNDAFGKALESRLAGLDSAA